MSEYSRDSVNNVIHNQIKQPIRSLLELNHLSSSIKLIYSGIDTMAYLSMPKSKDDVTKSDFIAWSEKYIRFEGSIQLTGYDLYGARCSMLHNHSVYSRLSRQGKCRLIGYADKMIPPIKYDPTINDKLVIVSVPALANAFFKGTDDFLIDIFSDSKKRPIAETRLRDLVHSFSRSEPFDSV